MEIYVNGTSLINDIDKKKTVSGSFLNTNIEPTVISYKDLIKGNNIYSDFIDREINKEAESFFYKYLEKMNCNYFNIYGYQKDLLSNTKEIKDSLEIGMLIAVDPKCELNFIPKNKTNIIICDQKSDEDSFPARIQEFKGYDSYFKYVMYGTFGKPVKPGFISGSFQYTPISSIFLIGNKYLEFDDNE